MRDYSKVSAQFWVGKTGRSLRGDMQTQLIAMYLMTSPHANMIGVYHCPIVYIAHETGSPIEGASKGLRRLCDEGFCTYDEENEMVWVHEMAKFQIGDELKTGDKQIKGLQKQYETLPEGHIKQGFYTKYKDAFHLPDISKDISPLEAPSKPLRSQEQEQEQEQEREQKAKPPTVDNSTDAGSACKQLKTLGITGVNPHHPDLKALLAAGVTVDAIVSIGHEPKAKGKPMAWVLAAVKGRIKDAASTELPRKASAEKQWFESASGIEDRGRTLGVTMSPGEPFQDFKARVFKAAKLPADLVRSKRIDAGMRP
jgi:hypothetical protein